MEQVVSGSMIYAVYHEYESDFTGDYTLSISAESFEGKEIHLDDETCEIFPVEPAPSHLSKQNVFNTWQKIWSLEKEGKLNRRYQKDFEKYEQGGSIAIYISVK
ncbi:hypothetical protein IW492_07410 [Enterococcus sp. BWB1-3]|nr:hypothetical protein [Enterococcus sp. BWB1-3]MBL1229060.1 hypothetical protein [Enterococcus sp. BWB1-3]